RARVDGAHLLVTFARATRCASSERDALSDAERRTSISTIPGAHCSWFHQSSWCIAEHFFVLVERDGWSLTTSELDLYAPVFELEHFADGFGARVGGHLCGLSPEYEEVHRTNDTQRDQDSGKRSTTIVRISGNVKCRNECRGEHQCL